METGMQKIRKIFADNKGATAIEYGLIAALIAVAAITAMTAIGSNLDETFEKVATNVKPKA
jgi:pilus assembly protein Flp/PilA